MYRVGQNNILHRCLTTLKSQIVLKELHEGVAGGHFSRNIITKKIMDARYWWPTLFKDTHDFCKSYNSCQKIGGFNKEFGQVCNNTYIRTFYEMGSRFYRSNQTNMMTNEKQIHVGSYRLCNQMGRGKGT